LVAGGFVAVLAALDPGAQFLGAVFVVGEGDVGDCATFFGDEIGVVV
jgi:hypothetical protein